VPRGSMVITHHGHPGTSAGYLLVDCTAAHCWCSQVADGNQVPVLGLGVWQVPDGPECVNAASSAGAPCRLARVAEEGLDVGGKVRVVLEQEPVR
jgi:hypothetical protein